MNDLHQKDHQETHPKAYEHFIIKIVPYVAIVEIIFLIGIFLLTLPGRLLLFQILQAIGPWVEYLVPEVFVNNTFGNLVYLYIFGGPTLYCNIFTSYENCSVPILQCNFTSYKYCSVVGSVGAWDYRSQIPSDYTKFINSLVEIVVPVIIALKLLAVYWLFKQKKMGWNLVFYSSLVTVLLLLVSRNIVGFIIFTFLASLCLLYPLYQVRKCYK